MESREVWLVIVVKAEHVVMGSSGVEGHIPALSHEEGVETRLVPLCNLPLWDPKREVLRLNPSSLIQNKKDQTERIKYGSHPNQTLMTKAARNHTSMFLSKYCATWLIKIWKGSAFGMFGAYSLVNRKGVLHSSQCFFWEWESHSIKQSWWTYFMLPLHLHG
jgi:hypothetical protein